MNCIKLIGTIEFPKKEEIFVSNVGEIFRVGMLTGKRGQKIEKFRVIVSEVLNVPDVPVEVIGKIHRVKINGVKETCVLVESCFPAENAYLNYVEIDGMIEKVGKIGKTQSGMDIVGFHLRVNRNFRFYDNLMAVATGRFVPVIVEGKKIHIKGHYRFREIDGRYDYEVACNLIREEEDNDGSET